MKTINKFWPLALRILAAVILLQTLFYKFSAAPESVYIFSVNGMEPWGRIGVGIAELIAALLLLIPATVVWGALFALALMSGAIASHLFILGIVVLNDGGSLFALALLTWLSSLILLVRYRMQLRFFHI